MIEILHKSKDFIVCIKPQGTPSQPDPSGCLDMTSLLKAEMQNIGEAGDVFVVHRLDRATGGLMVYPRNKSAAAEFSRLVATKDGFEKHYMAIVGGAPEKSEGRMTDYLFKDSSQKKVFVVKSERKGAKLASLEYRVLQTVNVESKDYSLLQIKLETGRFHQIRAQLSSRGMPIYGDGKYGSREKAPCFALWANKLEFVYRGKNYSFSMEPDNTQAPWNMFK